MSGNDRDEKGRFAPGNTLSPGRPPRSVEVGRELGYLATILGVVSVEDWRQVIEKALEQAMAGDHRSREWLAAHLVAPSLEQVLAWKRQAEFLDEAFAAVNRQLDSEPIPE